MCGFEDRQRERDRDRPKKGQIKEMTYRETGRQRTARDTQILSSASENAK